MRFPAVLLVLPLLATGCAAIPDIAHEPQFHNPFPQLHRVAILPFFNQSADPTIDGDAIALVYYNELQKIPGFEVMPVGVASNLLRQIEFEPQSGQDFQRLAQQMGVDAIIVGSVTEFTPYYPPRMGLSVRWYAANPGFHPIPPGYGLPWGTSQEEFIPDSLVFEAEFALARKQLETQTPIAGQPPSGLPAPVDGAIDSQADGLPGERSSETDASLLSLHGITTGPPGADPLPPDWPDPRGFIPPPPSPERPVLLPQDEAVIRHTRLYHGNDSEFTRRLASYVEFQDDARFGGWQGYLQRSDDFVRFCCYLHITETLAARGGAGKTRVVWRWPIGRYEP
jgi:hypothetical protein